MALALLEVRHSRVIAPTRRVALGRFDLPTAPAPGFGSVLLGGVVAAHLDGVDPELMVDLHRLVEDVVDGRRIPQPRLRHRFQSDTHGLVRTEHRLVGHGQTLRFDFGGHDSPTAQVLAAVYALGRIPATERAPAAAMIRRALRWTGPANDGLVSFLTSGRVGAGSFRAMSDPESWAREILGFDAADVPSAREVQRRFRSMVRAAHPDHGGESDDAAQRVTDLGEARRILSS